jgi:hypothetical protein
MTATLLDAQVALIEAQRAADLRDLDEAFRWSQRAAFLFLDLRGSTDPIPFAAPEGEPPALTDTRRPPGEGCGNSRGGAFSAPVQSTGQAPSCPGDSQANPSTPRGQTGSDLGSGPSTPNVREVE